MCTVRSKKGYKNIQQRSLKGFITVALAKSNYNEMFLSIYYIVKVLNKKKIGPLPLKRTIPGVKKMSELTVLSQTDLLSNINWKRRDK